MMSSSALVFQSAVRWPAGHDYLADDDPLAGQASCRPGVQGLKAALPYVDEMLHSVSIASLEHLAARLVRPFRRTGTYA